MVLKLKSLTYKTKKEAYAFIIEMFSDTPFSREII